MKIEQFDEFIQKDLAWRKLEISQLFMILNTTENKEVVTKSIVLLLYAHWEGFLKKSFKYYLKYVIEKKVKIKNLTVNFKAIVLKNYASECIDKDSLNLAKELQLIKKQEKLDSKNFKVKINVDDDLDTDIINTHHNLTSKVLKNICEIIGVEFNSSMKSRSTYIDTVLLHQRNTIGHAGKMAKGSGSPRDELTFDEVVTLKNFVVTMLDYCAAVLQDYVENEFYLKANESERDKYEERKEQELSNLLSSI